MVKCSCYNCSDREVGCHANCIKYKIYRNALDVINERKRKIKNDERSLRRVYCGKSS